MTLAAKTTSGSVGDDSATPAKDSRMQVRSIASLNSSDKIVRRIKRAVWHCAIKDLRRLLDEVHWIGPPEFGAHRMFTAQPAYAKSC